MTRLFNLALSAVAVLLLLTSSAVSAQTQTRATYILEIVHYSTTLPACKEKSQADAILEDFKNGRVYKSLARYDLYARQGKCVPLGKLDVYVFKERFKQVEGPKGTLLTPAKVLNSKDEELFAWTNGCVITVEELEKDLIFTCGVRINI
ncbi:MAG: hypothetical protein ISR99_00280 [Parcubacteria group bacterium]|nr:hypothetical protein [Parcubacteria group bacterium]